MNCINISYTKQSDGSYKQEITRGPMPPGLLKDAVEAKAAENPGRIAFGAQHNDDEPFVDLLPEGGDHEVHVGK